MALATGALGSTADATTISPLPESNYVVQPICPAPEAGHAGCLALELQPTTAAARAHSRPIGITRQLATTAAAVCEPATAAEGCYGLRPEDLRNAYFPGEPPDAPDVPGTGPQTIALVDAYGDYAAEADLKVYDNEFELPELAACSSTQPSDCFERVNQEGDKEGESATATLPFPRSEAELVETEEACLKRDVESDCHEAREAGGWAVETSTDIETARAICHDCKLLLVEARSSEFAALEEAEETAVRLGATEVSDSWGGEPRLGAGADFDHPGTVLTASAGDDGYLNWTKAAEVEELKRECLRAKTSRERKECEAEDTYFAGADFPAASPDVVAVGGTKLELKAGVRTSETVWNEDPDAAGGDEGAGGGGCSTSFSAPQWQLAVPDWAMVGCGSERAVADVAADADPDTGVAVYDSVPDLRVEVADGKEEVARTALDWLPVGGTSVASPIVAAMFALAGGSHGVEFPAETLYSHLGESSLYDVTSGGNGKCDDDYGAGCLGSLTSTFDCGEAALICNAAKDGGYDGPTGVGAPNGTAAFRPTVDASEPSAEAALTKEEESRKEEAKSEEAQVSAEKQLIEQEVREQEQKERRERVLAEEAREREEAQQLEETTRKLEETRTAEVRRQEEEAARDLAGPGSSDGQGGTATTTPGGSGATTSGGSGATDSPKTKTRILGLSLTRLATIALLRPDAIAKQVSFKFKLSAAATVHATLARRVRRGGHSIWGSLSRDSLAFSAARGAGQRHLTPVGELVAGRYRLTLAVKGGGSRSIVFSVR